MPCRSRCNPKSHGRLTRLGCSGHSCVNATAGQITRLSSHSNKLVKDPKGLEWTAWKELAQHGDAAATVQASTLQHDAGSTATAINLGAPLQEPGVPAGPRAWSCHQASNLIANTTLVWRTQGGNHVAMRGEHLHANFLLVMNWAWTVRPRHGRWGHSREKRRWGCIFSLAADIMSCIQQVSSPNL